MKFIKEFEEIITPKFTSIKKNQSEIKNKDVLGRLIYWHQEKNLPVDECIDDVLNEIITHKYLNGCEQFNIKREISILFTDWKKCKKLSRDSRKKCSPSFNILKLKLDTNFKKYNKKNKDVCVNKKIYNGGQIEQIECDYSDFGYINNEHDDEKRDKNFIFNVQKNLKKKKVNILTKNVVAALDRTKISTRSAVHILAAVAEASGISSSNMVLNRESIRNCRKTSRVNIANDIIKSFSPDCALTIHWDGKKIQDLKSSNKVERLAVHVTGNGGNKFLCILCKP